MAQAIADLEDIRFALGIERWMVLGHSWGGDLAVRYALDCPASVARVVGIAGHGLHKDRSWSEQYERGKASEPQPDIPWNPEVWRGLNDSFLEWIHQPRLFRDLAESSVPMRFVAAGNDIRPSWPLQQLAALVPHWTSESIPGVPHDFWLTHPEVWTDVVARTCSTG
jgi:proline iminopeptidase